MKIITTFLFSCILINAYELPPEEIQAQKEGLKKWAAIADGVNKMKKEAAIEVLGQGVRKLSTPSIYSSTVDGVIEVTDKIKNSMISIPGHATYYQDRVERIREEALKNVTRTPEDLDAQRMLALEGKAEPPALWSAYTNAQDEMFRVLEHLPSPETVKVLGYYLNDPTGMDGVTFLGDKLDGNGKQSVNAREALRAISKLGIEHPPSGEVPWGMEIEIMDGHLNAWKDWWNEVAAGKRVYRFKGSPVAYGPDGPVSADELHRVERNRKREELRQAGVKSSGNEAITAKEGIATKSLPVIGLIASCLFCAAAVWYFLRGRK